MKRIEEIDQQEQLLELLKKRKEMLKYLISEKEKALKSAPEGTLRVLKRPNGWQYYRRTDPKDTNGIYIPKKRQRTARELAQKGYDRKVLDLAKEELEVIKHYEDFINTKSIKDLFALMMPGRKELITPVFSLFTAPAVAIATASTSPFSFIPCFRIDTISSSDFGVEHFLISPTTSPLSLTTV